MSAARLENVYISAGCNRSPNCLAWRGNNVLYASCDSVVHAVKSGKTFQTLATLIGHSERVNCVRWIDDEHFLSCSTDGTVVIWRGNADFKFEQIQVLKGHEKSVTVASGLNAGNGELIVASASGDSTIQISEVSAVDEAKVKSMQVIDLKSGFALDLQLAFLKKHLPVLFAALDDCKIWIYGRNGGDFSRLHSLSGHEGWIHSIDFCRDSRGEIFLASCSQDSFIRIWRIAERSNEEAAKIQKPVAEMDEEEDITLREDIFALDGSPGSGVLFYAVSLETVLAGHEDKVFSIQWKQGTSPDERLSLLSCSMDKTMIIWNSPSVIPDGDKEFESDLWTESVRVGEVGGNVLGFLGGQFAPNSSPGHEEVLGYSFNGAFHSWVREGKDLSWNPGVTVSGHFAEVEDLDWESSGRYIITVSADQTTRIHAPWQPISNQVRWHEVARPQVHGHDLKCLTALPNHRFASGAEEKIVRVFEATKMFLTNLAAITKQKMHDSDLIVAQGASVPSLGLSNKAVLEDESSVPEKDRHVKDQYPDHYFKAESYDQPPPEESLVQNTLWPELQKLYGHGYEIFSLASDPFGSIIASACKASKAEHAEVILWDAQNWMILQKLHGHGLTVTQMEFSPCGRFFLSVSRDRTWCLFEKGGEGSESFTVIARTDKKSSIHQRLIWSCSWTPDSKYFATCSRDKKLAIWGKIRDCISDCSGQGCQMLM